MTFEGPARTVRAGPSPFLRAGYPQVFPSAGTFPSRK